MSDAQTLELVEIPIAEIARPNHSLILADNKFLSTLRTVEATVAGLKITDAQSAQQAADLLQRLTSAGTTLEKSRTMLKAPYLALMKQIDEAARAPQARIDVAKRSLSQAQTAFAQEQTRIAREAEQKRLADIAALEAKLAKERKDAADKAALIAEQVRKEQEQKAAEAEKARIAGIVPVEEENWDLPAEPVPEVVQKTETEKQIEAIRHAPAPVVAKPSGIREVVTLYPHLVDIDQVPDCFVQKTLRLAQIQSVYCKGFKDGDKIPVVSGIRFEVQRTTQSTGRGGF